MSDQVRDARRPGHFWADNEIVDDYLPAIGLYGFAVYMLLCKYADASGHCFPAVKTMAKQLGVSKPTVLKAVATLKEAGLISVVQRTHENGKSKTNQYELKEVQKTSIRGKPDLPIPDARVKDIDPSGGKPDLPSRVNHVDPNNTHIEQDKENTSPPVANAPVGVVAPPIPEPQREPAIDALMESISTEPESPLPELPAPPDGFVWVESSASTLQGTVHLAKREAKLPRALCKTHLKHLGMLHPLSQPCAECVRIAAKPKKEPSPAIYSSPALYDAIGAFSFGGGDAADLEPHRARIGVIRKALAKYVCDKLGRAPDAGELAAVVANVVAMPGEYRRRFKDREIAKGASTFMDAYKELFKNGNGTGNGAHYVWRGTEWEVHEGRVHVEVKPGIFRNIPASVAYWQSFLEEMDREDKHNAAVAKR